MNQDVITLKTAIVEEYNNAMHIVFETNNRWRKHKTVIPEPLRIAINILQMICMKSITIVTMSEVTTHGKHTPHYIDFSSLLIIVRNLYELCFIFHNIFVTAETIQESEILFKIWQIRGFNSRQNLNNIPDSYKPQLAEEEKVINELKDEILQIVSKLKTTEKVVKDIRGTLNYQGDKIKGFHFIKENGTIIDFKEIYADEGVLDMPQFQNTKNLYTWTSMHTHGSYLSILQFAQAYNSDVEAIQLRPILTGVYLVMKTVLSDFKSTLSKWNI